MSLLDIVLLFLVANYIMAGACVVIRLSDGRVKVPWWMAFVTGIGCIPFLAIAITDLFLLVRYEEDEHE